MKRFFLPFLLLSPLWAQITQIPGGSTACPTCTTNAAALTANQLVIGQGSNTAATLGSLGSATTVLHGGSGAPSFSAVVLTTDVSGILPVANGGTNNAFFTVSGPATSAKTYTFPNSSSTILTDAAVVTAAQGGTGVANSSTITLAGALVTSGANSLTLTTTGATNVTLPTSGTLLASTSSYINMSAANCLAGTCAVGFTTPASTGPTATAHTGTNTIYGTADFPNTDANPYSVQGHFRLPPDWLGTIALGIKWMTSATTGSVVWQMQGICVTDAETADPSFNTAQTVTDAAKGTTLQWNNTSIASLTVTGCAADEEYLFKFFRDSSNGSDDLAATAQLVALQFKLTRTGNQ